MAERCAIIAAQVWRVVVSYKTCWWHVLLETDSGLTGLGEATHDAMAEGFGERLQAAAEAIIGLQLSECAARIAALNGRGLEQRSIQSGLDQAVCDLMAQQKAVPLHNFLGGAKRDVVPLYANINRVSVDRTAETFKRHAVAAVGQGYGGVKIAAFDNLKPDLCASSEGTALINRGLDRLAAVADGAKQADLMVDCHWRFDLAATLALIPELATLGIGWLECPLPETPDNIADLTKIRRVANDAGIRLCGLETFGDWTDVAPFVEAAAYDVIMPDVKHAGSLNAILEIAERAANHQTSVSLHNPTGPVAHFHSVQLAAVLGGSERLEVQWGESPLFFELTDPAPDLSGGLCRPSQSVGLGASFLRKHGQLMGSAGSDQSLESVRRAGAGR